MEAPEEVKKLAKQIFGKDVKLKITRDNIIQAEWWPLLGGKLKISKGLIKAYHNKYISLKDVEAILWHEHGEKTLYDGIKLGFFLTALFIVLAIFIASIFLGIFGFTFYAILLFTISVSFFCGILVSFLCVVFPLNKIKEHVCDLHSAINMASINPILSALLKSNEYNRIILQRKYKRFGRPSAQERIGFLKELTNICKNNDYR